MERLSRVACYFRWMRNATPPPSRDANKVAAADEDEDERETIQVERYRRDGGVVGCDSEASRRLCRVLESILLWENSVNSISVVIVFNILFWGIVVLEVRGFAAASSAALVIVLCYSTFEAQVQKETKPGSDTGISNAKTEQIEKIGRRIKLAIRGLKRLRKEQPGVFCTAVCSLSLGLWIIGRTMNSVLLAYTICMSILVGPSLLLKLPGKMILHKDWDNEIEEFLPAVTEDSLQVLTRAGESGDQSPTPTSVLSDVQNGTVRRAMRRNQVFPEFFEEEELMGLKMPSHEDVASADGVEVSELELSAEDTDVDGIKFKSGHFEKGSSSEEEEVELDPVSRKLLTISHSDESGSEFEIIDDVDNSDDA